MSARAQRVTIIGGGPGGYVAALRAAAEGLEVRLVERQELGGTCLNVGCVPSKALLQVATQRQAAAMGPPGSGVAVAPVDLEAVQSWKSQIVDRLRGGVGGLLRSAGVEVVEGTAQLAGPGRVTVSTGAGQQVLESDAVILATGSAPSSLPMLPVDGQRVLSSTEALELDEVPERVAIVGAGYIGLELATALHGFGSKVTVLEVADRVLPGLHAGAAQVLAEALVADGVDLRLSVRVEGDDGARLTIQGAGGPEQLEVDRIIVAVGRRPRTDGLGLETVGLATDPTGLLAVDGWCRTAADGVHAIGDITPGPALAHRASAQGKVVAEYLAGGSVRFEPAAIPAVVYTSPQISTVGWTVEQAEAAGVPAVEHRFPFTGNARALVHGDHDGVAYVVSDPEHGRLLGVHLVGHEVGEQVGLGALALEMGAVLDDVGDTVLAHPTLTEVIGEVVDVARGRPLHTAGGAAAGLGRRG